MNSIDPVTSAVSRQQVQTHEIGTHERAGRVLFSVCLSATVFIQLFPINTECRRQHFWGKRVAPGALCCGRSECFFLLEICELFQKAAEVVIVCLRQAAENDHQTGCNSSSINRVSNKHGEKLVLAGETLLWEPSESPESLPQRLSIKTNQLRFLFPTT